MADRQSLSEIFGATTTKDRPSLDAIFSGEYVEPEKSKKPSLGELPKNWVAAGLEQTKREMFDIPAAHLVNQMALNAPRAIANKMGYEYPEAKSVAGNILAKSAGILGGAISPVGKAIQGLGKISEGASVGSKVLQAAKVGAIGGAAYTPTEDIVGIPQRLGQAAVGSVLGGAGMAVANFPKLINLGGKKTAQAIAAKADKGFDALSDELSKKYETLFSKVKGTASVDDISASIANTLDEYPQATSSGKIGKILDRLSELKKSGKNLTATELNNLKQEIRVTIPKGVWNGTIDPDAMQTAKLDIYWKINNELSNLGGDEYKALNQEYRMFKQSEKLARKFFYEKGQVSDANVGAKASKTSMDAVKSLSSKLPDKEKFAQEFEAWRRGQTAKKVIGKAALYSGALGTLGAAIGLGSRRTTQP